MNRVSVLGAEREWMRKCPGTATRPRRMSVVGLDAAAEHAVGKRAQSAPLVGAERGHLRLGQWAGRVVPVCKSINS